MKEIKVKFTDKVINKLKQGLFFKKACGNFYGLEDECLLLILKSIENGDKQIIISEKENDPESEANDEK